MSASWVTFALEGVKCAPWKYLSPFRNNFPPPSRDTAKVSRSWPRFARTTRDGWGLVGAPWASRVQFEAPGTAGRVGVAEWKGVASCPLLQPGGLLPSQARSDCWGILLAFSPSQTHWCKKIFLTWIRQIDVKREGELKTKNIRTAELISGRIWVGKPNLGSTSVFFH